MYKVELTESYFPAQTDMEVRETTVGGILRQTAGEHGDALFLQEVDDEGLLARKWTYGEMLADVERLAKALLTRFDPGEKIVIWAPNIPEWVMCEFAFGMAGMVLVTANPGYQPRELKYVIEQSGATGLFIVEGFRGNPMGDIARKVVEETPQVREVIDMQDLDALFATGDRSNSIPDVTPDDVAQIQYTSGSTGFPKGVLLHHRGLTNNARHGYQRVGVSPGLKGILVAPLFHTIACSLAVLGQVQNHGSIVLPRGFDPALTNKLIESERINVINCVPTMLVMMLEIDDADPRDLTAMEVVGAGGAMVSPELIRRVTERMGCSFTIGYGLTEASPLITGTMTDDTLEDQTQTIGQAVPQVEVSIRNPADNSVMPLDTVGEICSRGYNTMHGYNDNPEATADTIDEDGWLHSGDLGRMDSRGYVTITGRVKEMIIRGGENLFPVEIENAIFEHPEVAQVAVVGIPDERMGEIPIAFVKPVDGMHVDPAALKSHCRELLAAQKTPAKWIEVQDYPLTGSGKIQKFKLRDNYLAGEYGDV